MFPFPSQNAVRKFMPQQFKHYPTTRVIIDGTEIFIQVPSSLVSQSQTWSQYKHHNTWKALVGISPTGCIIFVSKLWSGRVSDKQQTKECGILDLLEPGDNIMADHGYDIADILPPGVHLNIPPFKGQRDQLTAEESEETARIAWSSKKLSHFKWCHSFSPITSFWIKYLLYAVILLISYVHHLYRKIKFSISIFST